MRFDVSMETGDLDRADGTLRRAADALEGADLGDLFRERAGVLAHLRGRSEEAAEMLRDLRDGASLPGDLDDLLAFLEFERGAPVAAREIYEPCEPTSEDRRYRAVPAAMGAWAAPERPDDEVMDALREVGEAHRGDATLLRVRERLLDARLGADDAEVDRDDLIGVLNERLEVAESKRERISILTRLGELYEEVDDLDQAAADVYREDLELQNDHE
jgi:hypothetical protein